MCLGEASVPDGVRIVSGELSLDAASEDGAASTSASEQLVSTLLSTHSELSEAREKHKQCIKLLRSYTQGQARDALSVALEQDNGCSELLPVLFAQIAVNHVRKLEELRTIRAVQEVLQQQHEALQSENSELRSVNEALEKELRALAQRRCKRKGYLGTHCLKQFALSVALTAAATGAALLVTRTRS
eukprot:CAMPEP_0171093550 /NCGR_PEP_ID=MMETSP0766_2-20121228/39144_1 /TAXON_ID=439317 /ORGANISM="Gambierdiscus australes, Strain CAWD 149" /LENGTH=186 /DNA_ID=CAMNT_0011552011 /DNA_START=45 /DNA_END=605 /DNA_ORIENTATION=-